MTGRRINLTRAVDATAPDYDGGNQPAERADYNDRRQYADHRFPGQPLLAIGTEVTVHTVAATFGGQAMYVPTEQPGYVVAIEDIPDGVYEIWQMCEEHGLHKFYGQYEVIAESEKPDLFFLAMVEED